MRRLFLVVVVLILAACSGSPGTAPTVGPAAGSSAPSASAASSVPSAPAASSAASAAPSEAAGNGAALPAACAAGLAKYLTDIEPLVSSFDPATATLGDLSTADQAVGEKSYELLSANNSTAPYSCSEVGLEFAYFDTNTPWDGVMAVAGTSAPGTVGYLTAVRDEAMIDGSKVTDYGVEGCDAAVAKIKDGVAGGGSNGAAKMGLQEGLALLGLYKAYLADVRNEICPRDQLGNDEFSFFGALG